MDFNNASCWHAIIDSSIKSAQIFNCYSRYIYFVNIYYIIGFYDYRYCINMGYQTQRIKHMSMDININLGFKNIVFILQFKYIFKSNHFAYLMFVIIMKFCMPLN